MIAPFMGASLLLPHCLDCPPLLCLAKRTSISFLFFYTVGNLLRWFLCAQCLYRFIRVH